MNLSSKHLKTHSKPYQCHDCCHSFARATDLERHKIKHRLSTIKFACKWPGCTSQHGRKDNLKRHISGVHGKKFQQQEKDMQNELQRIYKESAFLDLGLLNGSNLLSAALSGNIWVASILLMQETDLATRCNDGRTALHLAVSKPNNLEMVRFLIDNGANISTTDNNGETPLYNALSNDEVETATILLEHGATLVVQNINGQTPLHKAVSVVNLEMVRLLLEHGADVAAQDNKGETPLYGALLPESIEIATLLLDFGADFNTLNITGQTPFQRAIELRHSAIVKLLVEYGADIQNLSSGGKSLLHNSVLDGDIDLTSLLLGHGADPHEKDDMGQTFLHRVLSTAVAQLLLDNGVDPNETDKAGRKAIDVAFANNNDGLTALLLEQTTRIAIQTPLGQRGLHHAVQTKNAVILRLLLEKGVDANVKDEFGGTPLGLVCALHDSGHSFETQDLTLLNLLLAYGADVELPFIHDHRPYTPLLASIHSGSTGVIELLVQHGADVNRELDDYTPLYLACKTGNLGIIKLLLLGGADIKQVGRADVPLYTIMSSFTTAIEVPIQIIEILMDARIDVKPGALSHVNHEQRRLVAERLRHVGLDIDASSEVGDINLLHQACRNGDQKLFHLLIRLGADINAESSEGTPLQIALLYLEEALVSSLLDLGADVNMSSHGTDSPLHMALWRGYINLAQRMLTLGANVDAVNKYSQTALHVASIHRYADMADILLRNGADINAQDSWGDTALHKVSYSYCIQTAKRLLSSGADTTLRDQAGRTALDVAIFKKHSGVAALLRNFEPKSSSPTLTPWSI